MVYTDEQKRAIFERTNGRCHLCHKKLAFKNYGLLTERGSWEVDHSIPRAKGGTDHQNNLLPAHIKCNRSKQARHNTCIRAENGVSCRPPSKKAVESRQMWARIAVWVGVGILAILSWKLKRSVGSSDATA